MYAAVWWKPGELERYLQWRHWRFPNNHSGASSGWCWPAGQVPLADVFRQLRVTHGLASRQCRSVSALRHTYPDSNWHSHSYSDTYGYTYRDCDCDGNGYSTTDANRNTHGHGDSNTERDSNADTLDNAQCDSNGYSYSQCDAYTYWHAGWVCFRTRLLEKPS